MKNTKKNETKKTPTYVRVIATALVAIMVFSAVSVAASIIIPMIAESEDSHEGHNH